MKQDKKLDKMIVSILVPAILENALLVFSDIILTGYIGRLSVTEISSYGIGSRIYGIYFSIFKGFAIGLMPIFAMAFGENNRRKGASLYKQAILLAVPVASILALIIWLFPELLLSTMTQDQTLLSGGVQFLKVNCLVYPLIAIVHINSVVFQADGNTKTPLYIAMAGNIVSILAGYILIIGIGSFSGLGLVGAAITNNIRIIVMLFAGLYLLFRKYNMGLECNSYMDKNFAINMLKFGVPTAIGNSFWNFASLFLSTYILNYGQEYYAAYQLGLQGEGFCDMMSAGFLTAAMALSGKAIGSSDLEMYKKSFYKLRNYCIGISLITMAFLGFFSKPVLGLLTDKQQLISIAYIYLAMMIFSQFPQHMSKIVYGYIRTAGFSTSPTIIDMIGIWGVRVFLCYLVSCVLKLDIIWVWIIIDLDQWVRFLLAYGVFKWKKIIEYGETNGKIESCHF